MKNKLYVKKGVDRLRRCVILVFVVTLCLPITPPHEPSSADQSPPIPRSQAAEAEDSRMIVVKKEGWVSPEVVITLAVTISLTLSSGLLAFALSFLKLYVGSQRAEIDTAIRVTSQTEVTKAIGEALLLQSTSLETRFMEIFTEIKLAGKASEQMLEEIRDQKKEMDLLVRDMRVIEGNQERIVDRVNNAIHQAVRTGEFQRVHTRRVVHKRRDDLDDHPDPDDRSDILG